MPETNEIGIEVSIPKAPLTKTQKKALRHQQKRMRIFKRDKGICQLCLLPFAEGEAFTLDHKKPKKDGGGSIEENLQIAHKHCNELKGCTYKKHPPEYYRNPPTKIKKRKNTVKRSFAIRALTRLREEHEKKQKIAKMGIDLTEYTDSTVNLLEEAITLSMCYTDDSFFDKILADVQWWLYGKVDKKILTDKGWHYVESVEHFVDFILGHYNSGSRVERKGNNV